LAGDYIRFLEENKKSPSRHLIASIRDFAAAKSCGACTQKRNQENLAAHERALILLDMSNDYISLS